MKKKWVCLILALTMMLGGCSNSVLTEEEYISVGDAIGNLIVKHSKTNRNKVIKEEIQSNNEVELGEQEKTLKKTQSQPINDVKIFMNETEIIVEDKVGIDVVGYRILNNYPNQENEVGYVFLEAAEESKLLVLDLQLKNYSKEKIQFNDFSEKTALRLVINDKAVAIPIRTLLKNDILMLDTPLEAEAAEEAVLIFQIKDSVANQIQSLTLLSNDTSGAKGIKINP